MSKNSSNKQQHRTYLRPQGLGDPNLTEEELESMLEDMARRMIESAFSKEIDWDEVNRESQVNSK